MMLHVFIHSRSKRAKTVALLDSGATKNFINVKYTQRMNLPIWKLTQEQRLFNVDRMLNKVGSLKYFTNMTIRTGDRKTHL
jgi:hypothetical protein